MKSALRSPTLLAALACAVLPFVLLAGGLTLTSATDVVIFAVACMALDLLAVHALARFHASAIGTVLLAIRENEQRAQFIGYPTLRYKQIAYMLSATLTGLAGVLFAFHHRFASADPTSISSSGELLA